LNDKAGNEIGLQFLCSKRQTKWQGLAAP